MKKSTFYLVVMGLNGALFLFLVFVHPFLSCRELEQSSAESKKVGQELLLTDLCLFPEARYTRHLSQADLHAPFQDHPAALEHFPSGSHVLPPLSLR